MKYKKINLIFFTIIMIIGIILSIGSVWMKNYFGEINFEQIIYHIKNPLSGVSFKTLFAFSKKCIIPIFIGIIVLLLVFYYIKKKNIKIKLSKKVVILYDILCILVLILGLCFVYKYFGVHDYFKRYNMSSMFIEENYIDPKNVNIIPAKIKKNLIIIYLESIESSMTSKEKGGISNNDYIKNLSNIAIENNNFNNSNVINGMHQSYGTSWSTAGYISTLAGIPIKSPFFGDEINNHPFDYTNVITLPDILEDDYNNYLYMGSDSKFGGIKSFFKKHGNFEIKDTNYYFKKYKFKENEKSDWGIYDEVLFQLVKEDLIKNSQQDKPFLSTIITIDTHTPGDVRYNCEKKYKTDYENSISCFDNNINDFLNWLKEQDFYKNTVIVLIGDHLTMNQEIFNYYNDERFVYNTIINSDLKTDVSTREYSKFDIFPTILSSIGYEIKGDRLGLGSNLYSQESTIIEKYGMNYVDNELGKKSKYYDENLLY